MTDNVFICSAVLLFFLISIIGSAIYAYDIYTDFAVVLVRA